MAKRIRRRIEPQSSRASEIPLTGELAEFRIALRAEVEAAKRASFSNAVPLSNGRLLSSVAKGFQYQFEIDTVLNLPGDTPGELRVPNRDPVPVIIISVDGLTITLSVEMSLGKFVPSATLRSDLSMLLLKLIERIESKANLPNPAGDRLLGKVPPAGKAEVVTNATLGLQNDRSLNCEQLAAVGSVLGRDITYVWGPPGTGKTHVIGAIGAEILKRGKSLLLVSHTNVAVDEAILQIAKAVRPFASQEIASGRIIRIGATRKPDFMEEQNKPLLLSFQRERRANELAQRKATLVAEQGPLSNREAELGHLITLHEWLAEAEPDTAKFRAALAHIHHLQAEQQNLLSARGALESRLFEAEPLRQRATSALRAKLDENACRSKMDSLEKQLACLREQLIDADAATTKAHAELDVAERIQPMRDRLSEKQSLAEATHLADALAQHEMVARTTIERAAQTLAEAERVLNETASVNWITRRWRGLPDRESQQAKVVAEHQKLDEAHRRHDELAVCLARARDEKAEIEELLRELAPYANIPEQSEQRKRVEKCRRELDRARISAQTADTALNHILSEWTGIQQLLATFRQAERCEPDTVLTKIKQLEERLSDLRAQSEGLQRSESEQSDQLGGLLAPRLSLLVELGLVRDMPLGLEAGVSALEAGILEARRRADEVPVAQARQEQVRIAHRLQVIAAELNLIEEALRRVEETVIHEASIVGATLTAAYLRDAVENRRFETVVLDEASMAPIPALWIAASVCDRAIAVVGDYRQLPPVVIAQQKHSTHHEGRLAQKWLGTDAFQHANLTLGNAKPPHFVALKEQHRMHPRIRVIASTLVYDDQLRDHKSVTRADYTAIDWLAKDWPYEDPVLLVDTEPLNAWVTSVPRGRSSGSRLNFMSATVCVDIALRMLAPERNAWNPLCDPRILVISPYRPHAQLVSLLLRDDGISNEVISGTVHTFQGAQADAVIFDLVNDTPHWRVRHFIPEFDDGTKRLINVALTRPKNRVIVVGDFKYCQQQAKRAFLGQRLIPFLLRNYPIVNALEIVPDGLAGRAAAAQSRIMGGASEAEHERVVVRQDRFYSLLIRDLSECKRRIIIYSPFMTHARLAEMETHLKAALARSVAVVVVTKSLEERSGHRQHYQCLERELAAWGVQLIHKKGMHEKLVLIDSHTVWTGSLNPLSFRDTQEIMERRRNERVYEEYAKTLMVEELLHEFSAGAPSCPVCGAEILAAEGRNAPFYVRCSSSTCAYSRSIEDDALRDGVVVCKRCGGYVRLVEKDTDGRARWVCKKNARHKQLVRLFHLRLPKMREGIAKSILTRLEERLTESSGLARRTRARKRDSHQQSMFE